MQNGAKNRVTGTWWVAIGRVILALALIGGGGAATAAASANPPVVSGVSPTRDTTPTWSWTPGGGGNGGYRYKLDAPISTGGFTKTTATTFAPATPLSDGPHTLYVQESDAAGSWSVSGCKVIVIDATGPGAPVVSGTTPTDDTTPTWSWVSGGGGKGTFQYRLDSWNMAGAPVTTALSYTPATPLSEGRHTLYARERDTIGNWSPLGSKVIVIRDTIPPGAPVVSGTTPTDDTHPTWTWVSGGGGNGAFQYQLDSWNMAGVPESTALTYTPAMALAEGKHTLYVRERDTAGNWSLLGSKVIRIIDTIAPGAPQVSVITPTDDPTPTWSWVSGGGGNGTFRYQLDNWSMAGAPVTNELTFTAATRLSDGKHTLYVQECDNSGNWSALGQKAIVVQAPPVVLSLIPDTGQTQSYTATFGEDSDYTINPPSYSDNGDGTVTDNVTNLMWQRQDDNTTRTWDNALAYCAALWLAGYFDWRLPAVGELIRIVDRGHYSPAIDQVAFPNTNSSGYWSSTTDAGGTGNAWGVWFSSGGVGYYVKPTPLYARCVRGGQ